LLQFLFWAEQKDEINFDHILLLEIYTCTYEAIIESFVNLDQKRNQSNMTTGLQASRPQNSLSGDTGNESGSIVPVIERHRRYDRGIRVWGAHGQEAVEQARICLLNAGSTGAESLKNLVLGGIHSFTIVDGQKVEATDVGNNYLITASSLGGSRAQCVTECLKELNETVKGSYVEEDPATLLSTNPDFFNSFDLVIATQLPEVSAIALDSLSRERGVALVLARSYGLVGYLRVSPWGSLISFPLLIINNYGLSKIKFYSPSYSYFLASQYCRTV